MSNPPIIRLGEEQAPPSAPIIRIGEDPAEVDELRQPDQPALARAIVRTGPSGLLLGAGPAGPLTLRLFRPVGTRLLVHAPEYVGWLIAYRCVSLGAHLSIVTRDSVRWQALVDAVHAAGGTADVQSARGVLPAQGRPYRPSLIIDDSPDFDGASHNLGAWQALMVLTDAAASGAVHELRRAHVAVLSPCDARVADNLRRAYSLTADRLRETENLEANEIVVAMPRRLVRASLPPTQTEYAALFG